MKNTVFWNVRFWSVEQTDISEKKTSASVLRIGGLLKQYIPHKLYSRGQKSEVCENKALRDLNSHDRVAKN